MDDKLHKPATAVAREPDANAADYSWAADHWAIHLPGWLTAEQQEQLVAEHNSWSPADNHQRATVLLGGFAPARRPPASTDETADRSHSALPEWLVEIGRHTVRAACGQETAETWRPDTARFDLRDADSADLDHPQPHLESTAGQPIVTFHVGDTVVRRVSLPSRPTHAVAELVLRAGDALVALTQSRNATTAAHPATADPSTGLLCQHLTVTIWTSR